MAQPIDQAVSSSKAVDTDASRSRIAPC
jgi:hypothetical protein